MFHRLQMKWSFCAASVVSAAKPVFHLTCRAVGTTFRNLGQIRFSRTIVNTTAKRRGIPERLFRRFLKATTTKLVADARALNVPFGSAQSGCNLAFEICSCSKTPNLDASTRNYLCRTSLSFGFSRTKPYPVFDPQTGKRPGEGWSNPYGPLAVLFESRPLLWLPQFKSRVN